MRVAFSEEGIKNYISGVIKGSLISPVLGLGLGKFQMELVPIGPRSHFHPSGEPSFTQ